MNAATVYWLGWFGFGLGNLLRGVGELRVEGVGWLGVSFTVVGVVGCALAVAGHRSDGPHGQPSDHGIRSYGMLCCGVALLVLGGFELAGTF
ncbi:hypothetical protein [Halomarina oriensis]|uniref:Uncharacterized protein n=1 Tax=Halomarina oriensis TaxID=671145 RepID=A0A6B0GH78_9EURY|nr:hypothetical protein [Halomarina oriensis]MWG33940.1 hypothetical protein [Halomarina oriensis]